MDEGNKAHKLLLMQSDLSAGNTHHEQITDRSWIDSIRNLSSWVLKTYLSRPFQLPFPTGLEADNEQHGRASWIIT